MKKLLRFLLVFFVAFSSFPFIEPIHNVEASEITTRQGEVYNIDADYGSNPSRVFVYESPNIQFICENENVVDCDVTVITNGTFSYYTVTFWGLHPGSTTVVRSYNPDSDEYLDLIIVNVKYNNLGSKTICVGEPLTVNYSTLSNNELILGSDSTASYDMNYTTNFFPSYYEGSKDYYMNYCKMYFYTPGTYTMYIIDSVMQEILAIFEVTVNSEHKYNDFTLADIQKCNLNHSVQYVSNCINCGHEQYISKGQYIDKDCTWIDKVITQDIFILPGVNVKAYGDLVINAHVYVLGNLEMGLEDYPINAYSTNNGALHFRRFHAGSSEGENGEVSNINGTVKTVSLLSLGDLSFPNLEHQLETKIIEPTSSEQGYTLTYCVNCDYSYKDNFVEPQCETIYVTAGEKIYYNLKTAYVEDVYTIESDNPNIAMLDYFGYGSSSGIGAFAEFMVCGNAVGETYVNLIIDGVVYKRVKVEVSKPTFNLDICKGNSQTFNYITSDSITFINSIPNVILSDSIRSLGYNGFKLYEHRLTFNATDLQNGAYTILSDKLDTLFDVVVNVSDHDYVASVIEPTTTEKGYTLHKCNRCGNEYKDNYTDMIAVPDVTVKSYNLILSGQLGLKVYVTLTDAAKVAGSYIEFNINGKKQTVPYEKATIASDGSYVFTCYVSSIEMADDINITYHYGSKVSTPKVLSVNKYVQYILSNQSSFKPEMVELAKAISDYGYYAQKLFSKTKGWTMGVEHKTMPKFNDLPATMDLSKYSAILTPLANGMKIASYSLLLDTETTLKVYVDAGNYSGTPTFKVDGVTVSASYNATKKQYTIQIPGISAHKIGNYYEISVDGAVIGRVSPLSYANQVMKLTGNEELKQSMIAFYNYYQATMNYKNA